GCRRPRRVAAAHPGLGGGPGEAAPRDRLLVPVHALRRRGLAAAGAARAGDSPDPHRGGLGGVDAGPGPGRAGAVSAKRVRIIVLQWNGWAFTRDCLGPLVEFMAMHPRAGAVAPLILYAEPADRVWFRGGVVNLWLGLTAHSGIGGRDPGKALPPARAGYLTGCALMVRRAVLEKV